MSIPVIRSLLLCALFMLGGCSSLISQQTSKFSDSLSASVLNSDDVETVRQGAPAYLILLDALVQGSPDDADLLAAGAQLYNAYAAAFVSDDKRSKLMANKAFDYAKRSLCQQQKSLCDVDSIAMEEFQAALADSSEKQLPALYLIGSSWISWLTANSDDWNAIAQLPRAKAVLEKVVALDDRYDEGGAHLYLGGIATLLPPAMGGKPEEGRTHFEKAIEYSAGKNLLAKVIYAQQYARLVFDQALHNKLLTEVMAADVHVPGLTLSNVLAQQQAEILLADEADYF
jgi:hypothetical protein